MTMNRKTTVLLVDDHLVVRMGIASLLSYERDLSLVGEADSGETAVRLYRELRPEVVIMDLMMPGMGGAKATAEILRADPTARILILSSFTGSPNMRRAVEAGALGAMDKNSSKADLLAAIRTVAAGKRLIDTAILGSVSEPRCRLSPRQTEIIALVAKGFTNAEIANLLGIGLESVKEHLKTAFTRLGVANRAEAATAAALNGLLGG